MTKDSERPGLGERVVALLTRRAWVAPAVLCATLALVVLSATVGDAFSFSDKCAGLDIAPTDSLHVYESYQRVASAFPGYLVDDTELVLVQRRDLAAFANLTSLAAFCDRIASQLRVLPEFAALGPRPRVETAFSFHGHLVALGQRLLAPDATVVLITRLNRSDTASVDAFVTAARAAVGAAPATTGPYTAIMTGRLTLQSITQVKTGKGFAISDGTGIVPIVLLFWYMVGSPRLLILPGVAVGAALISSYAMGVGLATHGGLKIPSYEPDIMLFLSLALSIDYSFFLLIRLQEERRAGADILTALGTALTYSGSTVMVSGGVLAITWLALMLFPVYGLSSLGICSALTVVACVTANMALTPSILLTFQGFFGRAGLDACTPGCCGCCGCLPCCARWACCRRQRKPSDGRRATSVETASVKGRKRSVGRASSSDHTDGGRGSEPSAATALLAGMGAGPRSRAGVSKGGSFYIKLATRITSRPCVFIVPAVVFAVFAAGCSQLAYTRLSLSLNIDLGSGPATVAYSQAVEAFPTVATQPAFVLLGSVPAASSVLSAAYFAAECEVARRVATISGVVPETMVGVSFTVNMTTGAVECMDEARAQALLSTPPQHDTDASALYKHKYGRLVGAGSNSSALVTLSTSFDPFGDASRPFVASMRNVLAACDSSTGATFYFYGDSVTEVDALDFTVARLFPVLGVTLLLIFSIVALRFRAAIVPIKLALTLVVPIMFMFGLAVLVFQRGALNWLGWPALASNGANGLSWLLPTSTVFLLVGLALDYDIFLFARVYELRRSGLSDRDAIVEAVGATGTVISAAGVIMALAFSGMLANSNRFLNQFGAVAIGAVLLDTFVVRTLVVPSLLAVGGWVNWWPVKMPAPETEAVPAGSV